MIKIKLERWKEVVRLEVVKNDINERIIYSTYNEIAQLCIENNIASHIDQDCKNKNIVYISIGLIGYDMIRFDNEAEATQYIDNTMILILKYNNSVKDDGYRWKCDGCGESEKCFLNYDGLEDVPDYCPFGTDNVDWHPINNNKIEIVE